MAKNFFYFSLGMLCMMVTYNLGAREASADFENIGCIVAADESTIFVSAAGQGYRLQSYGGGSFVWNEDNDLNPPVPVSEIKFYSQAKVVTTSDVVWARDEAGWHEVPQFPGCTTTNTEDASWGEVKEMFR